MGMMMQGRTALVVGYGHIAQDLIPRLKAFGVGVVCVRRSAWRGETEDQGPARLLDGRGTTADLPRLLPQADLVFVTCPQNEENRGMVNRGFLAHCKDGVRIVNVARGGLLDYTACKEGLESGKIAGLGLDVQVGETWRTAARARGCSSDPTPPPGVLVQWEEPIDPSDFFANHPSVILTPHIAGVTGEAGRCRTSIAPAELTHRRYMQMFRIPAWPRWSPPRSGGLCKASRPPGR